ncbi:hypothetical protein P154DRAFT_98260 [Amniculicola lignicola CBS 123094]|uniref:Aminoglycoside phosphotransferase domain-containing protein n=1 Tax=Amniculicola lignicola CBS 123094 TaxID=1392246 RepID=A0A6A5VW81_9PLEO|nr:hypothetical protein P154DRAFT_98260 [Amniculicola lignicola CBS 123094]
MPSDKPVHQPLAHPSNPPSDASSDASSDQLCNQLSDQHLDQAFNQGLRNLSAAERCEQYFGANDLIGCLDVMSARNRSYKNQHSDIFPYTAKGSFDPPLPTLDEIIMAREGSDMIDIMNQTVWRVGQYIVKTGVDAEIYVEAENLLYLEQNSTVRAPKLYAAFTSQEMDPLQLNTPGTPKKVYYYLIMELIEGEELGKIDKSKLEVGVIRKLWRLLGEQLCQLRSVKPEDPKHFGRIHGRPYALMPLLYHAPAPDFTNYGPFTYEQLVQRLICSSMTGAALGRYPDDYGTLQRLSYDYAEYVMLKLAGPNDRLPVLSHLDLQAHNIIVKLARDKNGEPYDVEEVTMVDFFSLCWMPPWYEAGNMCMFTFSPDSDHQRLGHIALEKMGNVNLVIAAFLGVSAHYDAFHFFH